MQLRQRMFCITQYSQTQLYFT